MKLSKKALGLSIGIVWGLMIFIATLWVSVSYTHLRAHET